VRRVGGIGAHSAIAGVGVSFAVGWQIAVLGAVAIQLSRAYGVGLATIGLFVTVQFVMHMLLQVPAGTIADRWGSRNTALLGMSVIAVASAIGLVAPNPGIAFVSRAIAGAGTALSFVSASDYIRGLGGTPTLQGLFGGASMLSPGMTLAVLPSLTSWLGWRAPYISSLVVIGVFGVLLALAPSAPRRARHAGERFDAGILRDRRLFRFSVIHAMSFGFSVVVGNWVVTLLQHHGQSRTTAALAGSLTLALGFFTRTFGGSLLRRPDASRWVAASLVVAGAAACALALPLPLPGIVVASAVVGLASGIPFAMAFTGAARARPDAPGAAVGFVNTWSSFVIVVGAPLVGLTFSLPGDGRIGFLALGAVTMLAALATPRWKP
jgi:MFS family permease